MANWKEHGTIEESNNWVKEFAKNRSLLKDIEVVVCPPFTTLSSIPQLIRAQQLPIAIGAQDISRFEEGKHTGEVSAKMVSEFASYVIIGHSERRSDSGDTDEIVAQKVKLAQKHNLAPIICISEMKQVEALKNLVPSFAGLIAYEPLFAIGTGNPDTPENANAMAEKVKAIFQNTRVLYGGSVDGNNVALFLKQGQIEGVLVGNRSADASFFLEIVKNAN